MQYMVPHNQTVIYSIESAASTYMQVLNADFLTPYKGAMVGSILKHHHFNVVFRGTIIYYICLVSSTMDII